MKAPWFRLRWYLSSFVRSLRSSLSCGSAREGKRKVCQDEKEGKMGVFSRFRDWVETEVGI